MAIGTSNIKITDLLTETGASSASLKEICSSMNIYCANRPNNYTDWGMFSKLSSTAGEKGCAQYSYTNDATAMVGIVNIYTEYLKNYPSDFYGGRSRNGWVIQFFRHNIELSKFAGYNHNATPKWVDFALGNYGKITGINVFRFGPFSDGFNIADTTNSTLKNLLVRIIYYNGSSYESLPLKTIASSTTSSTTVTYGDLLGTGLNAGSSVSYYISPSTVVTTGGKTLKFYPVLYSATTSGSTTTYTYYTIMGAKPMSMTTTSSTSTTATVSITFMVASKLNDYLKDVVDYYYHINIVNNTSSSVTYSANSNYVLNSDTGSNFYINSGNAITIASGSFTTFSGSCGMGGSTPTFKLYLGGDNKATTKLLANNITSDSIVDAV